MSEAGKETREEKKKAESPFGNLLRFWRTAFGMSQDELSSEVEVSTRHISFLESGRSRPSRAAVLRIAETFDLGVRDTNNLLVAAGFLSQRFGLGLDSPELRWLRKSLIFILKRQDPYPTCVTDPYLNVLMINKAWLRLFRDNSMPGTLDGPINYYHIFFSNQLMRPYMLNWEELACGLLMNLQQEVLLNSDPTAKKLLDELLTYSNIPENWQRRAVDIGHVPYQTIRLQFKDQSVRTYLSINNTVGQTSYIQEPQLIINTLYPTDCETYSTREELENDPNLKHPLLFY